MSQNEYNAGLPLWTVAEKYLNLVSSVATLIALNGNSSSTVSSHPQSTDEFDKQTEWSDTNLSLPLIFNFYHGLETIMKGFLAAKNVQSNNTHKLSRLLSDANKHFPDEEVFKLAASYINKSELSSPLREFFDENEITPDLFYQALKYADVKAGGKEIEISHFSLKYGGLRMADFYNQLATDAKQIKRLSVSLSRSHEADSV